MYKNIDSLIPYLHSHQLLLTLITNGSLLHRHLNLLPYLKKLIISLHTTQQELYQNLTQTTLLVSSLIKTITNIKNKYPDLPIIINSTLLKEYITQQTPIKDLLQFIKDHGLTLKILELSPNTNPNYIHDAYIPFLQELGFVEDAPKDPKDYKNKKTYRFKQAKVILRKCGCDLINYYNLSTNKYCKDHNDIVISPDGYIGFCINNIKQIPLYYTITHRDSAIVRNFVIHYYISYKRLLHVIDNFLFFIFSSCPLNKKKLFSLIFYLMTYLFNHPYDILTDIYIPGPRITADLRFPKIISPTQTRYEYTKKYPVNTSDISVQVEHTFKINPEEFEFLSDHIPHYLTKKRYRYPYQNLTIEIDIFEEKLSGLVMADIEYTDINDLYELPNSLGPEVTQYVVLSGGCLFNTTYEELVPFLILFGYNKLSGVNPGSPQEMFTK